MAGDASNNTNIRPGPAAFGVNVYNYAPASSDSAAYCLGTTAGTLGSGAAGTLVASSGTSDVCGSYTAAAGANSLTVSIAPSGGYAWANSPAAVTISQTAYSYASPSLITAGPVAFGYVHVGAANPAASLSIANRSTAPAGYQDSLNAAAMADNSKLTGGSFAALAAGGARSLTLTADASSVGSLASNIILSYTSNANGVAGLSNSALATGSTTTTGLVYSGSSTWTGTGVASWGTTASGFGAHWGLNQGSPGLDPNFASSDTATFAGSGGTITLDGASPSLAAINFDSAGPYTLAQGSGGSLTLNGGMAAATVTVSGGTQTFDGTVGLILAGGASIAPAAGRS